MTIKRVTTYLVVSVILVFIISTLIGASQIDPIAWNPPTKPSLEGVLQTNELLQKTEWIDLEGWYGPEDIAIDAAGNLYCGVHKKDNFDEGAIIKIDQEGKLSIFCETGKWVTGLHFDAAGNLIACDQKRGLISVNPQGEIKVLANKDEYGRPFLIPNDVDIANDGKIYFSSTSSRYLFSTSNALKIVLEARPDGGLFCYDPKTQAVETLIDSSFFGNGVAIAQDDAFVLMVDLAKYRVLRYWLKGPKKGTIDTFIDNLPGLPNGISRRADGSFWLGFSSCRNDDLDNLQPSIWLKKLVFGLPDFMKPGMQAYGMVMHLSATGEILKTYYDTSGKRVPEASSIEEQNGTLYLGGDLIGHIGKYKL
ncbi:MAG: SMP-30/gluconolactonase/LRE family protein [Aureispira sp.]